ncbi:uncharacterized protein At2g23090-like isoform X1 [Tripterygium wilfordii]|uniref:uncharacterized protein At2g23090-like isoform X1 n=1 Tax=Tripterygium wilfordii TaxID=458696 RepID=UPI0018F83D4F|nr:uncharacterized protein At2g23090-like isoform X1 [Tripterygium wilfordii]
MGGGNGQKAKMAREKNLEKSKGAKGSQLDTNKKAMSIQYSAQVSVLRELLGAWEFHVLQCKVCMQTFMCTTTEVKCKEHAEAKHPKSDLYACFPHLKK